MGYRIQPSRFMDHAAAAALLLLTFAGYIKGNSLFRGLPIDLTLVGLIAVSLLLTIRFISLRGYLPKGLLYVADLWVIFLIGYQGGQLNPYADSKLSSLYTATLAAAVGGAILLATHRSRRSWLTAQVALGAFVALMTMVDPNQVASERGRLADQGANTIAAGRATGAAFAVLVVVALHERRRRMAII